MKQDDLDDRNVDAGSLRHARKFMLDGRVGLPLGFVMVMVAMPLVKFEGKMKRSGE